MDGKNDNYLTSDHPTIYHVLLTSNLGPEEKTLSRLVAEGQSVVGAGIITTAHSLKVTSYHIIANPSILQTLKAELATAMPDPTIIPPLAQLEQLPYLSAVVKEGFRMSYGTSSRLHRVSPDTSLVFHEWVIPPGTPVSMTSVLMHDNPTIFPEPKVFRPERWLEDQSTKKQLDRYLVNFSKGTRSCLGINLAHAESYFTMAAVFRRFDLELFETTRDDVDIAHDFFNPVARLDSKGVRVLVK
jgi:cytochrome P450